MWLRNKIERVTCEHNNMDGCQRQVTLRKPDTKKYKIIEKTELWGQKSDQWVSGVGEWGEIDYKGYTGIFRVDVFCVVADNGS